MARLRDRVRELVASEPGLTDRELTDRLVGPNTPPQRLNHVARQLASAGQLVRRDRSDGCIGNYPGDGAPGPIPPPAPPVEQQPGDFLSEDDVKRRLQAWLEAAGWKVGVAWGHQQGIDIDARRGDSRWLIEAKGQGTLSAMRVNYFLGALAELLQRMDDGQARYSVALPDLPQFRRLWQRLPALAKERTRISALFVSSSGHVDEVP